jgi:glycosyltransferase involved in cell wall biosynthesis
MRARTERQRNRILLVTDAYPPMIGGADRAVQLLAHELRDRGHCIAVATTWQPNLSSREDDHGVAVYRLRDVISRIPGLSADPYRHIPPPFPDPESVWRFLRLIRRVRPELIHAYGWI